MFTLSRSKTDSLLSSNTNNKRWVEQIQSFLDDEFDDDDLVPVCIFNVPKSISCYNPQAYTPQLIALGPYHHWRDDLYEMERYKLLCAKRVQAQCRTLNLQHLIEKLMKIEYQIRACYHKYLDMDAETLGWMMAIDGLFLLEFLHIYVNKRDNVLSSSARMSYLASGKKLAYDEILKDLFMLENQIPVFVLKKILRVKCSSGDLADNLLPPMLLGVCKELSPLKLILEDYPFPQVLEHAHLLDLLYHLILRNAQLLQQKQDGCQINIEDDDNPDLRKDVETLTKTWSLLSKVNLGLVKKFRNLITKLLYSKPLQLLLKLPLKVISNIPILSVIAPMLENFLPSDDKEKYEDGKKDDDESKTPVVEEILIPSVSDLFDVGITFVPTDGGISTIRFDVKKRKIYLPVVHLDHNTEFVMRNLVAYEASAIDGPLVFGRYTELMNGIIDTAEDVKLLRESKIIVNRLKSDQEVADFWNGMNRSIKLTRVPFIDKVIYDVNMCYNNTQKVKFYRMMKTYVYGSWKMLILLATILLLALTTLQSFCSVYSCPRLFNLDDDSTSSTTTS